MPRLRRPEGYLMIDHRDSPGITENDIANAHRNIGFGAVTAGNLFESATITCAICNTIVVLNPDRSRSRNYHPETNRYICDNCAGLRHCNFVAPADQAFDYVQEQFFRKSEGYNPLPELGKTSPIIDAVNIVKGKN